MFDFIKSGKTADPRSENAKSYDIPEGQPIHVDYTSREVPIPADFLSPTAAGPPVTITPIDWASTDLPDNEGRFAAVLDNVLSPGECAELIRLAESSVDLTRIHTGGQSKPENKQNSSPWIPAMINAGGGFEVLDSRYRNSDRIVWDQQEVVDRLWARCLQGRAGEVLRGRLEVLDGDEQVGAWERKGPAYKLVKQRWLFNRLNQRMRFLKYGPRQFFKRKFTQKPLPPS